MRRFAVLMVALAACGQEVHLPDVETPPDSADLDGAITDPDAALPDAPPPIDASPIDGATVFAAQCAECHGASGEGNAKGPQMQNPVDGFATYVTRHGRSAQMGFGGPMPAYDTTMLSDDDLAAVVAFLDTAPHPADAAGLYARFCANCHGPTGAGGRVHEPIKGNTHVSARVRAGHTPTLFGATKYMPAFPVSELSNAEVSLLSAYVRAL